jgi:hypothetical protein
MRSCAKESRSGRLRSTRTSGGACAPADAVRLSSMPAAMAASVWPPVKAASSSSTPSAS